MYLIVKPIWQSGIGVPAESHRVTAGVAPASVLTQSLVFCMQYRDTQDIFPSLYEKLLP